MMKCTVLWTISFNSCAVNIIRTADPVLLEYYFWYDNVLTGTISVFFYFRDIITLTFKYNALLIYWKYVCTLKKNKCLFLSCVFWNNSWNCTAEIQILRHAEKSKIQKDLRTTSGWTFCFPWCTRTSCQVTRLLLDQLYALYIRYFGDLVPFSRRFWRIKFKREYTREENKDD